VKLVDIEGPEDVVRGLRDIPDIILVPTSSDSLDGGRLRMSACVTARAVPVIEARGATITTLFDDDETAAHFAALDALIGRGGEPPPVA
jgi:hypothetical protein